MFTVLLTKYAQKQALKMPLLQQKKLLVLISDLERDGPIQPKWPNFSMIGDSRYHCHLSHKWVACWSFEKDALKIEVYYASSRENAPY